MVLDEQASLSFRGGPNDGKTLSLSGGPLVLGRGPDNDIDVNDDTVSRRHALMLETSHGFIVRDLNSANGTFINRERLGEHERSLNHGDRMRLGSGKVTLIFRQKGPTTLSMVTPPPANDAEAEVDDTDDSATEHDEHSASLTGKESVLIELLRSRKLSAVSVDEICRHVWPELSLDSVVDGGTLETAISRLRDHLDDNGDEPIHLITVGDFGYLLV
jgi:hypothetical protein